MHNNFDLVIKATGAQAALDLSTELVDLYGCLLLIEYHQSHGGMREGHLPQWNYKGIDVINGYVRSQEEKLSLHQAAQRLHQGRIQTKELITLYSFATINQGFQDIIKKEEGLMKVAILMEDHHGQT